ncbi:MAG: stage II sporulation protein P [bacterium]|jgi:stage II sporulation protein P
MSGRDRRVVWSGLIVITIVIVYGFARQPIPPVAQGVISGEKILESLGFDELTDGTYYTLVDDEGNRLMRTARVIYVGNQYLTYDNKLYEVHTVEEKTAYARFIKNVDLSRNTTKPTTSFAAKSIPVQQENNRVIGIYHSHGAESYVPSDGTESKVDGGGILQVGEAFAQALKNQQVHPIQSKETHVPHDAGAYDRSRRTVEELLQENPDALFDVHRDAVPAEEYTATIDGQEITQIQFVVGQQNQNQDAIQEFAESLKQVTDEKYPGLIKGIFHAKGNYNQDMSPRSLLLEVGSHENSREQAERAMNLFADATTTFLYGEGSTAKSARASADRTAGRSIFWLLLIAAIAGGIYLYVATGSWEKASQKLRQFTSTEFLNFLGRKPKPPRKDDES